MCHRCGMVVALSHIRQIPKSHFYVHSHKSVNSLDEPKPI